MNLQPVGTWNDLVCEAQIDYICKMKTNPEIKSPNLIYCYPEEGGGLKFKTSCYHLVTEIQSWSNAEEYCKDNYNGHLLIIRNDFEDLFLDYALSGYGKEMWIGIKVQDQLHQKWTSGWYVSSEKLSKEEKYVENTCVARKNQREWLTIPCSTELPFICEVSKAPGLPQNITISSNSSDSLFVGWSPPKDANEYSMEYIISYNESKRHFFGVIPETPSGYMKKIDGLKPFSTYTIQVQACILFPFKSDPKCSEKSPLQIIRTHIAEPGYIKPPRILKVNSTHIKILWSKPTFPNGPIDYYLIKWQEEGKSDLSVTENTLKLSNANSTILDMNCSSLTSEGKSYLFYVQAVNRRIGEKKNIDLYGELSEATRAKVCHLPEEWDVFIAIIIGSVVGVICFVVIVYQFIIWFKTEYDKYNNFTPILPKELEGQITDSPFISERFQLSQNRNLVLNSTDDLHKLTDKKQNMINSGCPPSTNSTDNEVKLKKKMYIKLEEIPIKGSSDCTSIFSNITPRINLSSRINTDPKQEFLDSPHLNSSVTDRDQPDTEKNIQQKLVQQKQYNKHENNVDDVIFQIPILYSKFGYIKKSDTCIPLSINPLVLFNCNLANSEPCVIDRQKGEDNETTVLSKIKSNSNVSLSNIKQKGYYTYPISNEHISLSPGNLKAIAMKMLKSPDINKLPTTKMSTDDTYSQHKIGKRKTRCNEFAEIIRYDKLKQNETCVKAFAKDYLQLNDVRITKAKFEPFEIDCSDHTSHHRKDSTVFREYIECPHSNHREEENISICAPE